MDKIYKQKSRQTELVSKTNWIPPCAGKQESNTQWKTSATDTGLWTCRGSWKFIFCRVTRSKHVHMQPGSSPENRACPRAPPSMKGGWKAIANCARCKACMKLWPSGGKEHSTVYDQELNQAVHWQLGSLCAIASVSPWGRNPTLPDKTCPGLRKLGGSMGLVGRSVKKEGQGGEWWQNRQFPTHKD